MRLKLFFLTIGLFFSLVGYAQDPQLSKYAQPLNNYTADYKGKIKLITEYLENNTTLTLNQKLQEYSAQVDLLRTDFKKKRKAEYYRIEEVRSVEHSCTKGSSGGTKKCGTRCTEAPNGYFYTKQAWITNEGQGSFSVNGDLGGCVYQQKSGRGRIYAKITAKYKIRPDKIMEQVNAETNLLFSRLVDREKTKPIEIIKG